MTPERWQRLEALVEAALELEAPDRPAFLDAACRADTALRREAAELLASYARSEQFLEPPGEPQDSDHPGDIGPYRVLHKLGEGGMGSVYAAERVDGFEQKVALKVLHRGQGRLARRFRGERQILARLEHPNIARLIDGGATSGGRPYFVMELVAGETITDFCESRRLNVDRRLEIFLKVCAAVHYAHRNMVVHRDIKPANILIDAEGEPKLLDFGIAKLLDPVMAAETVEVTATGVRPLTPQYASPEQLLGQPITSSADIYALGVLLYRLLTGRLPYDRRADVVSEIARVLEEREPSKPSDTVTRPPEDGARTREEIAALRGARVEQLHRRLKGDLDAILLKALRKEPEQRYASAAELAEDIKRHLKGLPVEARRGNLAYRAGKLVRRHRVAATGLAAAFVMAMGFTVSTVRQAHLLERQRDVAQLERDKARQVADFLVEIFRVADPNEARGRTITAEEILERGADRLKNSLEDQPETLATLLLTIGRAYHRLGLYQDGRGVLERSLALRRRIHGADHPLTAESLDALGLLLVDAGDLERGRDLLIEALEIRERHPEDVPALAGTQTNLANALLSMNEDREAETLFRRALELLDGLPEPMPVAEAQNLHDLGVLYYKLGDYDAAQPLLLRALDLRRRHLLPDHPDLASATHNLANVYEQRDETEAARPLFEEARDLSLRTLGEDHPYVGATIGKLGALEQSVGRFEKAEIYLRRAREIYARAMEDPNHHLVGVADHNLGYLRYEQALFEQALPFFESSVPKMAGAFGEDHPWVAISLHYRASSLRHLGDLEAAEALARRVLEIRESKLMEDHYHIGMTRQLLGQILMDRGHPELARPLLEGAVELHRRRHQKRIHGRREITRLSSSLVALARFERAVGEEEKARRHLEEVVRLLEPILPDSEITRTLEAHAMALLLLGRPEEARRSIEKLGESWRQPDYLAALEPTR